MNIFTLYLKTFTIPDISIPILHTRYMHEDQRHPTPLGARDLQTITMTFQICETQQNWYAFYAWIVFMRYGISCGKTNLKGEELLRMDCIDKIEVINTDNNNNIISKMTFGHCILNNLSSLELDFSTSEIATFTATFEVETIDFDLMTNEE